MKTKLTNNELIELLYHGKTWKLALLSPEPNRLVRLKLLECDANGCFPRYRLTTQGQQRAKAMREAGHGG